MKVIRLMSAIAKPAIIIFIIVLVTMTSATPSFAQLASDQGFEANTDRPGLDSSVHDIDPPPTGGTTQDTGGIFGSPESECQQLCSADGNCQTWTYVKPGIQGSKAKCYLKNGIPQANKNNCCTSGVIPHEVELTTDRTGFDYTNFDPRLQVLVGQPGPTYNICKSACDKDLKCQAWTYVKPRVQGLNARCWLKNQVPAANANPNTISGVKFRPGV